MLANRKTNTVNQLTRNSKIFKVIIKAIQQKKGENIVSLDLRKIPEAVTDFFVICSASNSTQVKAIADSVEALVKDECEESPFRHEGQHASQWVLVDYINVVVHVMHEDARKFYKLEEMWSDAQATEHS
jgi:ribosome-associated protein